MNLLQSSRCRVNGTFLLERKSHPSFHLLKNRMGHIWIRCHFFFVLFLCVRARRACNKSLASRESISSPITCLQSPRYEPSGKLKALTRNQKSTDSKRPQRPSHLLTHLMIQRPHSPSLTQSFPFIHSELDRIHPRPACIPGILKV